MGKRNWMLEVDIETGKGRVHSMDAGCGCRDSGKTPCGGGCGCHAGAGATEPALSLEHAGSALMEDNERLLKVMAMMARHMIVARKVRGC